MDDSQKMVVEMDERVTRGWLMARGGKFYKLGDEEFCDLPTQTFKQDSIGEKPWRRIE